jgi:DNA polymerase
MYEVLARILAVAHQGYSGIWVENVVQAASRDVLADALIRLHAADLAPVLLVHDEAVCEVPIDVHPTAEAAASAVETIMQMPPAWATGLPLAAEASAAERYLK